MLERKLNLVETLRRLRQLQLTPKSRFWFGSPCSCVRQIDVLVHIALPELIENIMPRLTKQLRQSSPRWGRSWRDW